MSSTNKRSSKVDLDMKLARIAQNESQIAELEEANQKLKSSKKSSQRQMDQEELQDKERELQEVLCLLDGAARSARGAPGGRGTETSAKMS